MADFDNGLPPEGTVVTESNISAVVIDTTEFREMAVNSISSVVLDKADMRSSPYNEVSSVVLSKDQTELRNRSMFL